ncbi:MAG: hypothetical protein P4L84_05775 [Isosphaeraceae bacterium]|nr:hypothetical protein [Isosphaeraceae bacterium]
MDVHELREELNDLRQRVQVLEKEINEEEADLAWQSLTYYPVYYATTGFLLGIFGAMASLLLNVIGAPIAGKSALELIRIYLTFPLGQRALMLAEGSATVHAIPDGLILAFGCCLYLVTGMLLGIPVYLALTKFTPSGPILKRFAVASLVSLAIWLINFYGILSWLQPALFGGNWIVDNRLLPWWVAAATHLVFGWTIVLLYPLGQFTPYRRPNGTERAVAADAAR